ncbi:pentapeptide repeat-containing protein [Mycobacterium spongiae]|uniref:Oxidoreductase n=1 Tax=Mycobacterium spongiae TaxID=886343 RepID=A0A975K0D5_9MYCO|nr:pentapeptide repeat-containing protein [Mycobacterium spongiae]QUR69045.1 hypothetical protein F6B93_19980 [Mycobacterium spongiae]
MRTAPTAVPDSDASSSAPPASEEDWVARLTEAAESGQCVDLAPGEALEPANGATWCPERQVPAAALRAVLTCTGLNVDSRGLRIRGARFVDVLDLDYVVFHHPLHLIDCSLEAMLSATGASFLALNLRGTHLPGIDVEWSEIAGSMFAGNGFESTGAFCAMGARIHGDLDLRGARLNNPDGAALVLNVAEIGGGVFAGDGFRADGEICAMGASIKGDLRLSGATLNSSSGRVLNLDVAEIGGGVFAGDGFESNGEIRAWDVRIKDQLDLNGATLNNPTGCALNLFGADVGSSVFAGQGFEANGEILAWDARIKGQLFLSGATLNNPKARALSLDVAEIGGGVFAGDGFHANGEIRAMAARTKGQIFLSGATLNNPNGRALSLSGAEIGGSLVAGDGFHADGEIRAWDATIKGQLDLSGATLNNPNGRALNLNDAEIAGNVFTGDGLHASGEIRVMGARIHGDLRLNGATLNNPNGRALSLNGAEIGDRVIATDGFRAAGEIRAWDATIKGQLDLTGATLTNPNGVALNLKTAKLSVLTLAPKTVEGSIVLDRADIEDLVTASNQPPPVVATGWKLGDIHGPLRHDCRSAKNWLNTAPPSKDQAHRRGPKAFTPVQPWYELANVYDRNGDPAAARHLRYAAANKTTKQSPWPAKLVRWIYGLLVGNGYHPWWAAGWLLVVVAVGSLLVVLNQGDIRPPHEVVAKINPAEREVAAQFYCDERHTIVSKNPELHGHPCFTPVTFALNHVLPAAGEVIESKWVVAPDATLWLTVGLPMLKFTAYVLLALLAAAVTGLLRKT